MTCSGPHCAGCAGGAAAPVVPLVAFLGIDWVVTHLVEVAVTSAVCGALAVATVIVLMRWGDRRDERRAAEWRLLRAREVPQIRHVVTDSVAPPVRPELESRALHLHFHGADADHAAAIIRQALPGRTGQ